MKTLHTVLQIGLGLMLLTFGLNKFFWFMPDFDFTHFPEAKHLFETLRFSGHEPTGHGYIMSMVGGAEVLIGLLLIFRKWVPFALVALVPISINLVAFHLFVNLSGIVPAIVVALINAYLLYINRGAYRELFL